MNRVVPYHKRAKLKHLVKVLFLAQLAACASNCAAQELGAIEQRSILTNGASPFKDDMLKMMARDLARGAPPSWGWTIPKAKIRAKPVPSNLPKTEPDYQFVDWFAAPRYAGDAVRAGKPGPRPNAPQTLGSSFIAINLQDEYGLEGFGMIPPDTMGAVGPTQFVEVINAGIAVYLRGGTRQSYVTIDSFFTYGSPLHLPVNGAFDPRVVYDRQSGRFIACALEFGPYYNPSNTSLGTHKGNIILAVSETSDAMGAWDKYVIPVGVSGYFTDFDTLGVDSNGVYFSARVIPIVSGSASATIAATAKAPLLAASPSLGTVYATTGITDMYATPQPATNLDAISTSAPAWIVSSSAINYHDVIYRTLTWSGGVPSLSASTVITTSGYSYVNNPPALGTSTTYNVEAGDDRLQMATIRGGQLWTCRDVGVNSSGGGGSDADRWACEWLALGLSGTTASLAQSGRIYDPSAAPRHYYYGSIAVTGQGHAAVGFSGSSSTQYIGCYTAGRLATDQAGTMEAILQLRAGAASYTVLDGTRNRWGDYSFTSLDPNDDMTIWTVQEYAASTNIWGTWVSSLMAPAPTITSASGSAQRGHTGVSLDVAGTGIYDPGSGFAQRLKIVLSGGANNGISNYAVTYNSPTSAAVTFDIAPDASLGTRDIVLTNPDGQSATLAGAFTITGASTPTFPWLQSVTAKAGRGIRSWAWLYRTDTWVCLANKGLTLKIDGTAVATATTGPEGGFLFTYTLPLSMATGSHAMTVEFAGDSDFAASTGSATLTVANKGDTTVWVQPAQTAPGQDVILHARLQCASDLGPLQGKSLAFQLDGSPVGSATTDADGFAAALAAIPGSISQGSHTITASFAGDTDFAGSTGTGTLSVVRMGSTYLWVASASGVQGGGVRIWTWLWRTSDWKSLANKIVALSIDGSPVQALTTNADGGALFIYTIPSSLSLGSHTISASFAGDANYNGCSASSTLTVTSTAATSIYVQPRSTGQGQSVLLSSKLYTTSDLAPVAGQSLSFSIDGAAAGSGTTGSDGFATTVASTAGLSVGSHIVSTAFAGSISYVGSAGTGTLTVNPKGDTFLWVDSASGAANQTVRAWAWLWRTSDWTSLANESIVFKVDGIVVSTVATNAGGGAQLSYTIDPGLTQGKHTLTAEFAGDGSYNGSTAAGTLTVTP